MKRIWTIAAAFALAAAAYAVWWSGSRREWTTDSPAALAAYERGLQAQMKFYFAEANEAFREALELDPGFVAARFGQLDTVRSREEREGLVGELRAADRSRLNERERFLLDVAVFGYDDDRDARRERIASYLERHPRDPWALMMMASDAWNRQDWELASRYYTKLLEVDPNWVIARNNLGYIAMAQGRFDEAEEQFRTYRYAAPDQANPHDSLGELYVLVGRYAEARAELEESLAVRPDFCASYENLFRLAVLDRRPEELQPIAARVEENCETETAKKFACMVVLGEAFLGGDPNAPWRDERCLDQLEKEEVLSHLLALRSGRLTEALATEERLRASVEKMRDRNPHNARNLRTVLLLLEGQRLLSQGDPAGAVPKLREVDADSNWWGGNGGGVLKLVARWMLAESLDAAGDAAEAEAVRERLRAVNAEFERDWTGTIPPPPAPRG